MSTTLFCCRIGPGRQRSRSAWSVGGRSASGAGDRDRPRAQGGGGNTERWHRVRRTDQAAGRGGGGEGGRKVIGPVFCAPFGCGHDPHAAHHRRLTHRNRNHELQQRLRPTFAPDYIADRGPRGTDGRRGKRGCHRGRAWATYCVVFARCRLRSGAPSVHHTGPRSPRPIFAASTAVRPSRRVVLTGTSKAAI